MVAVPMVLLWALDTFRDVGSDLPGLFNCVFSLKWPLSALVHTLTTLYAPGSSWVSCDLPSSTVAEWRWLTRINGLLSSGAHIQRNLMHAHLCNHHADAAGTWSQRLSPGVLPAASASVCPLSDRLTFSSAVTHRSACTGRAGEGIRDREREASGASRRLWRRENICCGADGMIAGWSNR